MKLVGVPYRNMGNQWAATALEKNVLPFLQKLLMVATASGRGEVLIYCLLLSDVLGYLAYHVMSWASSAPLTRGSVNGCCLVKASSLYTAAPICEIQTNYLGLRIIGGGRYSIATLFYLRQVELFTSPGSSWWGLAVFKILRYWPTSWKLSTLWFTDFFVVFMYYSLGVSCVYTDIHHLFQASLIYIFSLIFFVTSFFRSSLKILLMPDHPTYF